MAIGTFAAILGNVREKKATKALKKELANAPKYKINKEAFENKAIAQAEAFGRDRSIQMQQENLAQEAADATTAAKDVTSSSSALLSTIAQINANKNQALRGLSQDEAQLQNQKKRQLYDINNQLIDEQDKAWNYNVNMPFQNRVAMYRDKIKANQEVQLAGLAYEGQTASAFASAIGSFAGCDSRLKDNIVPCEHGLDAVMEMRTVEFDYIHPRFDQSKKHLGFIAQEMRDIIPQAISPIHGMAAEGEEQYLRIDFNQLVPVLVNAIQDQQKQIKELQADIEALRNPMSQIIGQAE